ncbi:DnaB-like helicase C-terminal domain-containing protein [Ferrovum sp.]|uniref:DnaB-like helicase C-terminal domain-containing protein n=1 Tax=Ferrovum sp. TaxID=2609467 RepID=UPI002611D9FD|nr:DnaB-like helicase C-terminal domain-containing protein [Ferrovum sp.]
MANVTSAAESSVVEMIGASFSGAVPEAEAEHEVEEVSKFEFDGPFQTRIASFAVRSNEFMRHASHLLKPEYFENEAEASIVSVILGYYQAYKSLPDVKIGIAILKDAIDSGKVRKDTASLIWPAYKQIMKEPLVGCEYVEEKLVEFVRHQAVSQAILRSVDLLGKKKMAQIEKCIKEATSVGLNEEGEGYDYFSRIHDRTAERLDDASGKKPPRGITTGIMKIDERLYHKGWGRKELSSIMGGAKAGKSLALTNFAKMASLKGHNVLFATLEVSARIVEDRLDASISDTLIKDVGKNIKDIEAKISAIKAGKLLIHEFASGTLTPSALSSLLDRYRSKGMVFDLVVVDYADIMAPNYRTNDPIENSKSVYIDLRAIAFEFDVALLTATQTNREGFKSVVAKAEHVAEDFNKIRTVDLMISINSTDEEKKRGESRLYFAASRNQEGNYTIRVKQDMAKMQFITAVLGEE